MDRTGIIVVTLCAILLGFWFVGQQKYAQQQARYAATNQAAKAQASSQRPIPTPVPTSHATATALPRFLTPTRRKNCWSSPTPAPVTRSLRAAAD